MNLRNKFLLAFVPAWLVMPVALLVAQFSGLAQQSGFIVAILLLVSMGPILIYVNEVFAPVSVLGEGNIDLARRLETSIGVLILSAWVCYKLELEVLDYFLSGVTALGLVWFSFGTARRLLAVQVHGVIGGKYSVIVGAIPPVLFLLLVLIVWVVEQMGLRSHFMFYMLVIVPTLVQYIYVRKMWFYQKSGTKNGREQVLSIRFGALGLLVTFALAFVSQQWKIALANSAENYAALSVYVISPVASLWLINLRLKFVERPRDGKSIIGLVAIPVIVFMSSLLSINVWWGVFAIAVIVQLLTYKYIADVRRAFSLTRNSAEPEF